ncbi:MAG: MBL fold metallo-hydrolase [Eggerthellaceae bacterium]|nr:MBL fold metallo-hydrolase [Eggerthellaceae bacterium]
MKITVLLENATPSDRYCSKHGLSMFIEADCGRILFDMGPDGSFIDNARALGIDVTTADLAVISHGHFDHGGGLRAFLETSESAGRKVPIYVHERAFEEHRANTPVGLKDIGIDPELLAAYPDRFVLTGDERTISEALELYAAVEMAELAPASNRVLLERVDDAAANATAAETPTFAPDSFAHEQTLLIHEGDRTVLVTGCSHCGIVNIMKKAEELTGGPLDAVVAGFHLMNPSSGDVEDPAVVAAVAEFMAARPTRYYTFHCTGLAAYSILRDTLNDRVNYLYTSSVIEL